MATFNILSSCICRDAFGFQEKTNHKIVTFLQATSALTWFRYGNLPYKKINMEFFDDVSGLSKFQKKCIMNDYNKTVLENFFDKTDFFITDMTEFASMDIMKEVQQDGTEHYFTCSKWFQKAYKEGLKSKIENELVRLNHLDIINDEIIYDTLDRYIQWILERGYRQDQVILVENKRSVNYTDGELLYSFNGKETRETINNLLDKIYKIFKERMPDAHVIKMPVGVLADSRHRWGLTDLHFCKEYYDYLYECFDMIAKESECKRSIAELRDKYSNIFFDKKEKYMINSFLYADGAQLINDKLCQEDCLNYIVESGKKFYNDINCKEEKGHLSRCFNIEKIEEQYATIISKGHTYFVRPEECLKGYVGGDKCVCREWQTANSSTLVLINEGSVIVAHNGKHSLAQTQIVLTVKNSNRFIGKTVTFSAETRVLRLNDGGFGGTLAIINANDYNKGRFYAKTDFVNESWKRVSVTAKIPQKKNFHGVTLCMRAVAGTDIEKPKHAMVEFRNFKFEVGAYPTKN